MYALEKHHLTFSNIVASIFTGVMVLSTLYFGALYTLTELSNPIEGINRYEGTVLVEYGEPGFSIPRAVCYYERVHSGYTIARITGDRAYDMGEQQLLFNNDLIGCRDLIIRYGLPSNIPPGRYTFNIAVYTYSSNPFFAHEYIAPPVEFIILNPDGSIPEAGENSYRPVNDVNLQTISRDGEIRNQELDTENGVLESRNNQEGADIDD
tara:strand:- start:739 stop:1365 length:627 start_codon:yes stop_codon:yes gene_type:complete